MRAADVIAAHELSIRTGICRQATTAYISHVMSARLGASHARSWAC